MTKETFKMTTDPNSGIRYIVKALDEETKNHKECDKDIISGIMPEMQGTKFCPVASYMRYLNALSTKTNNLWQTPKFTNFPTDPNVTEWYYGKMGHNKLDCFVSDVCKLVKTKNKYTNHSLRVTAISNLTRDNFNNKQIMSVTGHKSSVSLEIYQKVNTEEKIQMGFSLAESMTKESTPKATRKRPVSSTLSIAPKEKENVNDQPKAKLPLLELAEEDTSEFDFSPDDLISLVEECERNANVPSTQNVTNNVLMNKQVLSERNKPQIPSFNNCKIGHITININKA